MARRTRKIRHDEETRKKIQAAMIIDRFQKCVRGELKLTNPQVSCGKTLLDKVLPDIKAIEHSGPDGTGINVELVNFVFNDESAEND